MRQSELPDHTRPGHGADELRDDEMRKVRRENEQLRHHCTALERTIQTINRLSAHYANGRKPR